MEANGFKSGEYFIQTYNGVRNIAAAVIIAQFFIQQGADTHVLIHRDSDCMLPEEQKWFLENERKKLPPRCQLFLTPLSDVEHQFCLAEHLVESLGIELNEAKTTIGAILEANNGSLAAEFGAKRKELIDKDLRNMKPEPKRAADLLTGNIGFDQTKGKRLFGLLSEELTRRGRNAMKITNTETKALLIPELQAFAQTVWPPAKAG